MHGQLIVRREQVRVGQVIEEDDDWVTLKVAKNDYVKFDVEESAKFFTLLFVQFDDNGVKADFPWKQKTT